MTNFFNQVPLNTTRIFVRGVTASGCEVFAPVRFNDDGYIQAQKRGLQGALDRIDAANPIPVNPDSPRAA